MRREISVVFIFFVLCAAKGEMDDDGITEEFIEKVFLGRLRLEDASSLTPSQRIELESEKKLSRTLNNARKDPENFKANIASQLAMASNTVFNDHVPSLGDQEAESIPVSESLEAVLDYARKSGEIYAAYRPILATITSWITEIEASLKPQIEYNAQIETLILDLVGKKEDWAGTGKKYRIAKDLDLARMANTTKQSQLYDEQTGTIVKIAGIINRQEAHKQNVHFFTRHLAILRTKLGINFDPLLDDDKPSVQVDLDGLATLIKSYQELEGMKQNYLTLKDDEERERMKLRISAQETRTIVVLDRYRPELAKLPAFSGSITTLSSIALFQINKQMGKFRQIQYQHMTVMAEGINLDSELAYWMDEREGMEWGKKQSFGDPEAIQRHQNIQSEWRKKRLGHEEMEWTAKKHTEL